MMSEELLLAELKRALKERDIARFDADVTVRELRELIERLHAEVARLQHLDYENAGLRTALEYVAGSMAVVGGMNTPSAVLQQSVDRAKKALDD